MESTRKLGHHRGPAEQDNNGPIFSAIALSTLSADSPLFDALWPPIFEAADLKTKNSLELTSSYFRGMAQRAKARRLSAQLKALYIELSEELKSQYVPPNPLRLDPHSDSPLWYEWGADKAGFKSLPIFEKFCQLADVKPVEGVAWHRYDTPSYSFLSSTGDISFFCSMDPRTQDYAYAHYFGCTGERTKALLLEAWFMKHCRWDEVCHGGRDFG